MDVYLAIYDQTAFELSEQLLGDVESYIDQNYVDEHFIERPSLTGRRESQAAGAARVAASVSTTDEERTASEGGITGAALVADEGEAGATDADADAATCEATDEAAAVAFAGFFPLDETSICADAAIAESSMLAFGAAPAPTGLDAAIENLDEPFNATLLRLIDAKGKTDVEVYKRANISRKLFSKIRTGKGYTPSKRTIIALSIALELTPEETNDLLERAGYTLSHSQLFDVIVEFFIVRGKYDIFEINEVLFKYDQPLLGAS